MPIRKLTGGEPRIFSGRLSDALLRSTSATTDVMAATVHSAVSTPNKTLFGPFVRSRGEAMRNMTKHQPRHANTAASNAADIMARTMTAEKGLEGLAMAKTREMWRITRMMVPTTAVKPRATGQARLGGMMVVCQTG